MAVAHTAGGYCKQVMLERRTTGHGGRLLEASQAGAAESARRSTVGPEGLQVLLAFQSAGAGSGARSAAPSSVGRGASPAPS